MESDNDLEEENDDTNKPENSDDEISDDEDNEVLQNTAANDSAIETANLRNFPDLLRLNTSGWNTNTSNDDLSENEVTVSRPTSPNPSDHEQIMLEHNYSLMRDSSLSPIP